MATTANRSQGLSRQERVEVLTEQIDEALEELSFQLSQGHSEGYLSMLEWYAKLHKYSIGNAILIRMQRPTATLVAGYKRWGELGFTIKSGETGIAIRAPWLKTEVDPQTGEKQPRLIGYLVTYVWDISQTNEYPDKQPPTIFAPVPGDWTQLYAAIKTQVLLHGLMVTEDAMPEGIHGMIAGERIYISDGIGSFYQVTALVHEYVHRIAHVAPEIRDEATLTRDQREWEAESVTYAVCKVLGFEHETARDYLLSYHFTTEDLAGSIKRIQYFTKRVLKELDLAQELIREAPHAAA